MMAARSDSQEFRLPNYRSAGPIFGPGRLAMEAKRAMENLAVAQMFDLRVDGNDRDRYRRVLAHLVGPDDAWLQGRLVEMGLARVYTFSDNRRLAQALLRLEQKARQARKGIWGASLLRNPVIRPWPVE